MGEIIKKDADIVQLENDIAQVKSELNELANELHDELPKRMSQAKLWDDSDEITKIENRRDEVQQLIIDKEQELSDLESQQN